MSCPGSEKFPTAPLIIISGQDVDRGRGHDARGEVGDMCAGGEMRRRIDSTIVIIVT